MKLTKADLSTLSHAAYLARRHESGIFPRGASQHRHFAKLEKLGLLEFEGYGCDVDGETDGDVPVYRLTEAGRDAIPDGRCEGIIRFAEANAMCVACGACGQRCDRTARSAP